jgi:hypothetical protein
MTNTVTQQPLVSIEAQSSRRQLLADIDANLTDAFTHIGASGRTSLAALGDPLLIMDDQRFFAEVVAAINSNYDTLNAYQPGLALEHVAAPSGVTDTAAFRAFAGGIDTQIAAINAATAKPVNTVLPVVTGTPTVGQTLTCPTGTWSGSPSFTYQWQRDNVNIGGATANTYLLVVGDGTHNVRCRVTGTNAGGATTVSTANQLIAAS